MSENVENTELKEKKKEGKVKSFFSALWSSIKTFFTYNPEGKKPRVWELDLLRGLLILAVTFDHFCMFIDQWKLLPFQTEFGQQIMDFFYTYRHSSFRDVMQPVGLFMFSFLAGINSKFTRGTFRRVLKFWIFCGIFMGGFALLKVLFPDMLDTYLIFNIITVLTISFTVWWLMDLIKCPTWLRAGIGIVLVVIGLTYFYKYNFEDDFYVKNEFLALMVYNDHGMEMSVNNFEPLLPHLGWFLIGGVIGKFAFPGNKTYCKQVYPPKALRPLLLVGKHSLFFYLVGPVLVIAPAWCIVKFIGLFL